MNMHISVCQRSSRQFSAGILGGTLPPTELLDQCGASSEVLHLSATFPLLPAVRRS